MKVREEIDRCVAEANRIPELQHKLLYLQGQMAGRRQQWRTEMQSARDVLANTVPQKLWDEIEAARTKVNWSRTPENEQALTVLEARLRDWKEFDLD